METSMKEKKHSPFLIFLAITTYLCNLFDLWYTLYALDFVSAAREVNPVVRWMLGEHPLLVVLYKYALVPLGLYLLYRFRRYRAAVLGIYLCAACFIGTVAYQLLMMPLHWW